MAAPFLLYLGCYSKIKIMKGVTILTDEKNKKHYLQIDIEEVQKYSAEKMEDLYDILIANLRKGQPTVSIEEVEKKLKKAGKL